MSRPILLAWSGGKDSILALESLLEDSHWHVVGLLTTVTSQYDRIAIHGVRRSILHRQAAALGLRLFEAELHANADNAAYVESFSVALAQAQAQTPELSDIAFGDLFLTDVRAYRDAMLDDIGWRGVYPLWQSDTAPLARYFIDRGYRAILTCVDTQQLSAQFCGREFDSALLTDLPPTCDPCGERGEFHTCVYAGPLFPRPLALSRGERVLRDARFEYIDLIES